MKIKSIALYQVDLPYSGGTYHLSGGREFTSFDAPIICITAQEGTKAGAKEGRLPCWVTKTSA